MIEKIKKAFILAGGTGTRIQLDKKQNLKAFIEIDNKTLLKRHIHLIKQYLNPETIYVVITRYQNLFEEDIRDFEGVKLIFNEKVSNVGGLELLLAIKKIDKYLDPKEDILITLVDEYYDESDFKDFCSSIFNKNFSIMVASPSPLPNISSACDHPLSNFNLSAF